MTIPTSNLANLLLQTARRFPDRPALICVAETRSWGDLRRRVGAAAGALQQLGVSKGDRVLVHSRNSFAMFETMWAAWMIGAVWVPVNFRLTPAETAHFAAHSRAVVHFFDERFRDHAAAASTANRHLRVERSLNSDWEDLATRRDGLSESVAVDRDDPCWFFYTSGTTGRPKAAILTHGQMDYVVTSHLCDLMPGTTEQDVSLVLAPLSHGAGVHALAQVARGAASVLMPGERLDCAEAWRLVQKHEVSNMFTVPTILTRLTRDPAVDLYNHSSLRYVIYAGAPMYRSDQVHALTKLGTVLVQYYGLGEVTGNITVLPPHLHSAVHEVEGAPRSVGFARVGMQISIRDGEICVRGPGVFAGYFENEDANQSAFRDGWFHTGDLGYLDDRGFLFMTGRLSDMFISGGSNVYPREIEEALLEHPCVAEACIVGMPDERWGEVGVAVVVPNAPVTQEALHDHLAPHLARYKHPARYVFWDALPKTAQGKVAKKEIRGLLGG